MNRLQWIGQFLYLCGFGITEDNIYAMAAWMESEYAVSVPLRLQALNNPLDTEMPETGATDFNKQGVKNYLTIKDGLGATKTTIFNGYYADIIACLHVGNNADNTVAAINRSPWGSKPTAATLQQVRANPGWYLNALIHSQGEALPPTEVPQPPELTDPTGKKISPIVGGVSHPTGMGYWLVAASGAVYAYGDSRYYGGANVHMVNGVQEPLILNAPIVGMACTPSGNGYWLFGMDGGVFPYGDAPGLGVA